MGNSSGPQPRRVIVRAVPIELCQLLKFAGLTESGGAAKQAIGEGRVKLNGRVEKQKSKKIVAGDTIVFGDETLVVEVS